MLTHSRICRALAFCLCIVAGVAAPGCGLIKVGRGGEKLYNSLTGVETVVVVPVMNLSTSADLDMLGVTNALASELGQVKGLTVVPLARVYEYLAANKMRTVGSPEEAKAVAAAFKAQVTLVAAVTEYDPYDPPRMGLAMQMYATSSLPAPGGTAEFDPVEASRSGVPFAVSGDASKLPRDMVVRVLSGRDAAVEQLARTYAATRDADASPYGWRRFIVDQREFQRLCCYAVIRDMMGLEGRQEKFLRVKVELDHPR
jgi:hypothetical protein